MENFINVEDHGEWLNFRVQVGNQSVPVRITREAIDDHFGDPSEKLPLEQIYARKSDEINAFAKSKMVGGTAYTRDQPLILKTADF